MTGQKRASDLILAAAAQVVMAVGLLSSLKLIAAYTNPATYGGYAIGIAVAGTVTVLIFGPIAQLVLRYHNSVASDSERLALAAVIARFYFGGLALLAALLILIVSIMLLLGLGQFANIVILGCLLGCVSGTPMIIVAAANSHGDHSLIALATLLEQFLRVLFLYVLLNFFDNPGSELVLAATCVAVCVFSLGLCFVRPGAWTNLGSAIVSIRRLLDATTSRERRFVTYLSPFFGFALFAAFGAFADRYILQANCGLECVGVYAVAYTIANGGVVLVFNVLTQVLIPVMFAKPDRTAPLLRRSDDTGQLGLACATFAVVVLAGAFFGFAFGEQIVSLFASGQFSRAAQYVWILVACIGIFNVGQLLSLRGFAEERTGRYLVPKIVHAGLLVGLGVILTPLAEIQGMIAALLISALAYAAMIAWMRWPEKP